MFDNGHAGITRGTPRYESEATRNSSDLADQRGDHRRSSARNPISRSAKAARGIIVELKRVWERWERMNEKQSRDTRHGMYRVIFVVPSLTPANSGIP